MRVFLKSGALFKKGLVITSKQTRRCSKIVLSVKGVLMVHKKVPHLNCDSIMAFFLTKY